MVPWGMRNCIYAICLVRPFWHNPRLRIPTRQQIWSILKCPVISRQTLLSDEGALSLATSGQRRMAVSTDCLTQSTVVICPDTEIILINQRCRPFTNTPDIPGTDLHNHQHHKFFNALAHMEKHLMHLDYRLTSNDYYRLVSLVSSVKLVLSLSSLCSLLISKCILSGSLNQHQ